MDNQRVAALITQLNDEHSFVRSTAATALGQIGDASAVPALIEALKDEDHHVRWKAGDGLGKIGDASAVPALVEALQDKVEWVRQSAAEALGKIGGASAGLALIEALKDKDEHVRRSAADALGKIGDSDTLPRKILAVSRWSAEERITVLEKLRRVSYKDKAITLLYTFPETRALCQVVLNEEDSEAREGARIVLNWLDGGRYLLRGSQADTSKQSEELLRPVQGGEPETEAETLLRASDEAEKDAESIPTLPTVWQRIFGKRSGDSA